MLGRRLGFIRLVADLGRWPMGMLGRCGRHFVVTASLEPEW